MPPSSDDARPTAAAGATAQAPESARVAAAAPGAAAEAAGGPDLEKLFSAMVKYEASDLHLKIGSPPILRIAGRIKLLGTMTLSRADIDSMVRKVLTPAQTARFDDGRDLDIAYSLENIGRYRINIYRQRGAVSLAARRVRTSIPSFEELNLPGETLRQIANHPQGLIVVAGVTGSGKSTTLAATIEHINDTRRCHIVTIEDPIEYLYRDKKAFVNQREIGIDVEDFGQALKSVVRQDPDVILIGEMRDPETFEAGLRASETGHLVFGTLHSSTIAATIGRIIDLFPSDREKQIRQSLRFNLKAIICQRLLPSIKKGISLVPVFEILIVNATVQKVIHEGEDKKLEAIVRGGLDEGMIDFNTSLIRLVKQGYISEATALENSSNPEQLKMNLKGIFLGDDRKIIGS